VKGDNMPYTIKKEDDGWWVVKIEGGVRMHKKPHTTRQEAIRHKIALDNAEKEQEGAPPEREDRFP
jgi:hypothetical protein